MIDTYMVLSLLHVWWWLVVFVVMVGLCMIDEWWLMLSGWCMVDIVIHMVVIDYYLSLFIDICMIDVLGRCYWETTQCLSYVG